MRSRFMKGLVCLAEQFMANPIKGEELLKNFKERSYVIGFGL
jgi:hypothetical protein